MINFNPQTEVERIKNFITTTFSDQKIDQAVVAVSGGIDSALSLTLVTQTLGKKRVYPVFLPYKNQSIEDSVLITEYNQIPKQNWWEINIASSVDTLVSQLQIPNDDRLRIGNIMARMRMVVLFDIAKQKRALVCGTENKSEKYLGYFTRFGDEASDLEPIAHLYKSQVRQLAQYLNLPQSIITKSPSAGLWPEQTDEKELGFSYTLADQVLELLIDQHLDKSTIMKRLEFDEALIDQVLNHVNQMAFKLLVPYHIDD